MLHLLCRSLKRGRQIVTFAFSLDEVEMNLSPLQLINSCKTLKNLKSAHARLLIDGSLTSSDLILNKLIRLYSRYGSVASAHRLFDAISEPNPFLWTALLHGYIENCCYSEAFTFFQRMFREGVPLLNFTLSSLLKGLARQEKLEDGRATFGLVLKSGFGSDVIVLNAVIDFFMRCGEVGLARKIFDEMDEQDIISWNSMIAGYGSNNMVDDARELFDQMPDRNVITWTSMISAYIKAQDMVRARGLFDMMPVKDLASWNVMLCGYIDGGDISNAHLIFERMPVHDTGTWNMMLSGFCKAGNIQCAEEFFGRFPNRNIMSWTIMIDGYIKAGDMERAGSLFNQMPEKNLVTWSTMISGYAKNGQPQTALLLLKQFKNQGIKPDVTFILGAISACSQLGILETGESVVNTFLESGHLSNLQLVTALIDMYAKCGSIEKAVELFRMISRKDLLCYSTMMSAYANHGLGQEAIDLFHEMLKDKIRPDGVIFLALLSACNHAGLVTEGKRQFRQMTEIFGLQPSEKHYACMVDLLGRNGCLEDAYSLIKTMPMTPGAVVWGALLSACRIGYNVELAEVAAGELFKIEPDNSGNYTLLSNIYAATRMYGNVAKVRGMIKDLRVRKNRASSWIELNSVVHDFVMADESHVESDKIYSILGSLINHMVPLGCTLDDFGMDEVLQ